MACRKGGGGRERGGGGVGDEYDDKGSGIALHSAVRSLHKILVWLLLSFSPPSSTFTLNLYAPIPFFFPDLLDELRAVGDHEGDDGQEDEERGTDSAQIGTAQAQVGQKGKGEEKAGRI